MSEPATTATGAGLALGAVTITGTVLGLHIDALLLGLAAALSALMLLPPDGGPPRTPWRVFAFVASASFAAGVFAPLVALIAADELETLRRLDPAVLRGMSAVAIGATVHLLLPALRPVVGLVAERIGRIVGGAK